MSNVFIGQPNYDGTMHAGCAEGIYLSGTKRNRLIFANPMSLVSHNCNHIYVNALNRREEDNLEWLALLHSDIRPSAWWIDTLIEEADRVGADLMAACAHIKDDRGIYSVAISDPNFPWTPFTRLTSKQVLHPSFPDTFDLEIAANALEQLPPGLRVEDVPRSTLQVNTGCCIIRLNTPIAEKFYFDQRDTIFHDGTQWIAKTQSEDWRFSDRVASLGGRVFGTKKVQLYHYGNAEFFSHAAFGQNRDDECLES